MRIATWNVNSINARLPTALTVIGGLEADIVCLQELKCEDHKFPREAFEDLGWNVATHGQKTYNGVAILSKFPFDEVLPRLPGDESDEQARYLEAVVSTGGKAVRVASIYLPNGNPLGTEKFTYKLAWFERLRLRAQELRGYEEICVLAGDYNVIPRDEDCYDPAAWKGDALFQPESRAAYRALLNLGYTDAFMAADGGIHRYTFWDYQAGAWPKDHGIRIDHLALSPQATDLLRGVKIHRSARGLEKPSDHVPVSADLAI
jgi:exodeoxyribonuclease III